GTSFGQGRFRYDEDGTYTVTASLERGDGIPPLSDSAEIVVNGAGPSIDCTNPPDGSFHTAAAGSMVTIEGAIADANGAGTVNVNGMNVSVNESGRFQADIPVRFGINFVDISATDGLGFSNSRTCAFMAADQWVEEDAFIDGAVTLKLNQSAVDDGNRSGATNSLGDMLTTALNSQGLINTLDQVLNDANPLKPEECDWGRICVPFIGCYCALSSGVFYRGLENRGSNSVTLELINGGLRVRANIGELWVRLRVQGAISEIGYGITGWVKVRDVALNLDFQTRLRNGSLQATVINDSVTISIGNLDTDFSGLAGDVVDIVVDLFNGDIKRLITDTLRGYVRSSFDEILDSVLGGLDINSLGVSFGVPRLSGGGSVPVGLGLQFSDLEVNTSRMLFGLGLRFTTTAAQNFPSLGVPMPSGDVLLDPNSSRPISAGVHVGVINQVLHALWRGGLLDVTLTGSDIGGGLPATAAATINAKLPPVLVLRSGSGNTIEADAMLGGLDLELTYPGIFDTPIRVSLGANATTGVQLEGESLSFDNIVINELFFSTGDVSLDPTTRAILEDFFLALVQSVLDSALNNALPVLPIPSFALPNSLSQYGLPGGQVLGITNPSLSTTSSHAVLEGGFGIQ
ncbi:MAG: hypothetical protein AAFX99_03640, partial [Myxococcota bacterium]